MKMLLLLLLFGCDILPAPNLERMKNQPNLRPYEESNFFADGRAMRVPPAHTVPHRKHEEQPPRVDMELMQRGRRRFDISCAVCHGHAGDGKSEVAHNMDLRKPPSLVTDEVRRLSDARIVDIIEHGYGLMPSHDLDHNDRWAVVAYLRALQLSSSIEIERLPPSIKEALP